MRLFTFVAVLTGTLSLCACGGGTGSLGNPPVTAAPQAFTLSPDSVALTASPVQTFTVQDEVPGAMYTPTADPSCHNDDGGIYVAGDGEAQPDLPDTALQFTVYGVGPAPAGCTITITASTGAVTLLPVTYAGAAAQQTQSSARFKLSSAALMPSSVTVGRGQRVAIAVSGFSGLTLRKLSRCPTTGPTGISVSPRRLVNGSGSFYVVAYGQGVVNLTCGIDVTDAAGDDVTATIAVDLELLHKFSATPGKIAFSCSAPAGPAKCTSTGTVVLHESGAGHVFSITGQPAETGSCLYAFAPQMNMNPAAGGGDGVSAPGPSATVAFSGYLFGGNALGCHKIDITDNGASPQTVTLHTDSAFVVAVGAPAAPPACTGPDDEVRAVAKPHGMYVWNPNHFGPYVENALKSVIGHDATLCGASLVINWRDVNPARGVYNWSYVDGSAPPANLPSPAPGATALPTYVARDYVQANLRVNLLFADAPEIGTAPNLSVNDVTPAFVTDAVAAGGDGVPLVKCSGLPDEPYFPDAKFEADWATFIAAAVAHFSNASPIAANVGYMRFGQGFGTEDEPGHGYDGSSGGATWSTNGPACQSHWASASLVPAFGLATWQTHSINTVNAIAQAGSTAGTSKQLMIAVNDITGDTLQSIGNYGGYSIPNAVTAAAAAAGIGFGTENLGSTAPPTRPCAATIGEDQYWCAAVNAPFATTVPIEFQTITATGGKLDISTILEYAIDNHAQLLELYPGEWLTANGQPPTAKSNAPNAATQAKYRCALYGAGLVLGLAPIATFTPPACGAN